MQYYKCHKLSMVRKNIDLRKVVGSTIEAPAHHVIAEQECQRRFGSQKKVKRLTGIVLRTYSVKKASAKRFTTMIEADFDLETSNKKKKKKSLTIQMVKAAAVQPRPPPSTPPPRSSPRSPPPRPPSIETESLKCSFRKCDGVLPLIVKEVCGSVGCNERMHHICQVEYEHCNDLDLPLGKRCYKCTRQYLEQPRPPSPTTPTAVVADSSGDNASQNSEATIDLSAIPWVPRMPPLPLPTLEPPPEALPPPSPPLFADPRTDEPTTTYVPPTASPTTTVPTTTAPTTAAPTTAAPTTAAPAIVECHGVTWEENRTRTKREQNPSKGRKKTWRMRTPSGSYIYEGCDEATTMSRLDFFVLMFPPTQLKKTVLYTNEQLRKKGGDDISMSELMKFLGVCILITRFQFSSRRNLWSTTATSKYVPAFRLGQLTGMSRNRFDEIWSCLRWSHQPDERPPGMSHAAYRWMLVDGFVENFNLNRSENFYPGECICIDESIVRWYGMGGGWINFGLPHYIAIDRKPENGLEIQNAACGESGIMMALKLVKGGAEDDDEDEEGVYNGNKDDVPHGAKVMMKLLRPWINTQRIVCADSYFASVTAAELLHMNGLRFIGVVKTATRKFPMAHLAAQELENRGDRYGLVRRKSAEDKDECDLLSFVWMDQDRRYFIASASSLSPAEDMRRSRLRQVEDVETNADPVAVNLVIPQPKASKIYYSCCAKIDQHNRSRQDSLDIEKKLGTQDWDMRANLGIFGMCVVDAWLCYKNSTGAEELQEDFYLSLAEELIDNNVDRRILRSKGGTPSSASLCSPIDTDGQPRDCYGIHAMPMRDRKRGSKTITKQLRCRVCHKKTTHICSECDVKVVPLCSAVTGRDCFRTHFSEVNVE